MVVLAIDREIQAAVIADTEIHVLEAAPGIVTILEQQGAGKLLAVACALDPRRGARLDLLDVSAMDLAGRVSAGTLPALKDMRMAVYDH